MLNRRSTRFAFAAGIGLVLLLSLGFGWLRGREPELPAAWKRAQFAPAEAAGLPEWARPETCSACHADAHADWSESHHCHANRAVDDSLDKEAWQVGGSVMLSNVEYAPEKFRGAPWIVAMAGWDAETDPVAVGPLPARGVIGYQPLIQYLVPGPGGRWQAHAAAYDPANRDWFDVQSGEERSFGDWGHWSGQGMNWNANCAWCHLTDYEKRYDVANDTYASTWKAQAISCIQCHQDMETHMTMARVGEPLAYRRMNPRQHIENCASCHSRREELTQNGFHAGDRYDDHFRLALADQPIYFADGQARDENFVYGSFRMSKMGHAGITCLDCHQPHHGGTILPVDNNALCLRCHTPGLEGAPVIREVEHSHHAAGSSGNLCINCHMPHRTYMDRDPRRDHGFTSPDPTVTRQLGVPNACNQCHGDQSVEWAEQWSDTWYGADRRERERRRAHIMALAEQEDPQALAGLHQLYADEPNPFLRATYLGAANAFGPHPTTLQQARQSAKSDQPEERAKAAEVFGQDPRLAPELRAMLADPSRLVRVTAAQWLLELGETLPDVVAAEYESYLEMNADRPLGLWRYARWRQGRGTPFPTIVDWYQRASRLDNDSPLMAYNVAVALDGLDAGAEAKAVLERSQRQYPDHGLPSYGLGLLYAADGKSAAAIRSFERAIEAAGPEAPSRWYYNLVVICHQHGQREKAAEWLQRGLHQYPQAPELRQLTAVIQW